MIDRQGSGTSLGPRSPETEDQYKKHLEAREVRDEANRQLVESFRQYTAFRLPRISEAAGEALRALDVYGFLGAVQVVGTNALFAYQIEAQARPTRDMTATDDFDISWTGKGIENQADSRWPTTIFQVLKKVDNTYTINTERPFQARNLKGEEIELLLPSDLTGTLPPREDFRPIPMQEQNWLLMGDRVDHVIFDVKGKPCRIVAPDPRYFALQKMWLSNKPTRNVLKVKKDDEQGRMILDLVRTKMPHYPMDDSFRRDLPEELKSYYDEWMKTTNTDTQEKNSSRKSSP